MALQTRIETMATRVKEELDLINNKIGNISYLDTSNKTNIVNAINDLVYAVKTGGLTISSDYGNAITIGTDGGLHCPAVTVDILQW